MKKVLAICLVLVLAASMMIGCGTDTPDSNSSSSGSAVTAKKELVFAQSIAITSLDPAGMQPQGYPSGYEAAFAIFNGLIRFDEDLGFQADMAEKSPILLTLWDFG